MKRQLLPQFTSIRRTWAVLDVLTAILFVVSLRAVRDQRGGASV